MKIGLLNEMIKVNLEGVTFENTESEVALKESGNPACGSALSIEWQTVRNMPVSVKLRLECEVEEIVKIPQKENIEFCKTNDGVAFTVDKIKNHQLIVLKKKRV